MKDLETITEIRNSRKRISARFNHDPKRLVDYYKEKQKKRIKSQQGDPANSALPFVPHSKPE